MSVERLFDLKGKVALITGGHSGIGRAIAEGLAEAGADIIIAARRFEKCKEACAEIEQSQGVRCLPVRCDVLSSDEVNNLVSTAIQELGKVDILVNSAGVGGSGKRIIDMGDQDWDTTLNINLRGTFLCSRAAAREMIKQKQGKIINISSGLGIIAARNMGDYCASKSGVIQLTKVLALELTRYNIQVNAICPGYFLTPLNSEFLSSPAGKKMVEHGVPMQRVGRVEELKGIAVYLASPTSSFTTGAAMVIDGGQSLW